MFDDIISKAKLVTSDMMMQRTDRRSETSECDETCMKKDNVTNNHCHERSKLVRFFGKTLIFMTIISFLFIGLIINIAQLFLLITIKFSDNSKWKSFHKRVNSYLVMILFSPPIAILYTWSRINLNITIADGQLIEDAKRQMLGIIIPNHSYELDYMVSFALADQLGDIGNYKSLSKDELKYLPIIGWALYMADIVFVKRNWKEDKLTIAKKLNELFDYKQFLLGLFAEGTRFTPEKHQASVEFALSRNIKPLKHHLIPRTRGFNYIVRHYYREIILNKRFDEKYFRLFSLEIIMPEKLKFRDFMDGKQIKADVYCEEVYLTNEMKNEILNSKDENDCPLLTQLIHDIFRRKDKLVDEYRTNGNKFIVNTESGANWPFERRNRALFIWIMGLIFTYSLLGYLTVTRFADSYIFWSILVGFITSCVYMLKRIARESKAKRIAIGGLKGSKKVSNAEFEENKISPAY